MKAAEIEWRKRERQRIAWRIVRWITATLLIVGPFPLCEAGRMPFFFLPFTMLLGCIILAPDMAGFVANAIGSPFWSRTKGTPVPLYSIPESLAAKGMYVEAEQEYEKIIEQFPNESKPYIDMINIAIQRLHDGKLADDLYQRGMENLKDPSARQTLSHMYERIRSRLIDPNAPQKTVRRKGPVTSPRGQT